MKILIVEDDLVAADTLRTMMLKHFGISAVEIACTLGDGLRKSVEHKPDITLLDLVLPDSPSWQTTIDSIHLFKPPVIVVTELDDPNIKVAAFKAGAEDVFNKKTVLTVVSVLISAATSARMRRLAQQITENAT